MKKKQLALTTAMAATLAALPGCSSGNDWDSGEVADRDTAICVDEKGQRVPDGNCRSPHISGGGYHGWYYVNRGSRLPYFGDSVRDTRLGVVGSSQPRPGVNYASAPESANITRSAARSRGGFGSSGRIFGGGRS